MLICNASAMSFSNQKEFATITAIPEFKAISKETTKLSILTEVNIKNGWHLYWDNPGDTGDPTVLAFFNSPYYEETRTIHSAPKKSVFEEIITSYIHTKKLYFKTNFIIKNTDNISKLPFNLVLSYTACRESCFPEKIKLNFTLPLSKKTENNPTYLKALAIAETTFPMPLSVKGNFVQNFLELNIGDHILENCSEPEFVSLYPKKSVLSDLPKTSIKESGILHVDFNNDELPNDYKGLLLCSEHAYYIEPNNDTPFLPQTPSKANTLFYYLLTAFIAGLILNLMPCVLPILSLKALYLVQNKQNSSPLKALLYLLGVLSSFGVLSGILFYFRLKGEEMGWGFQLQSPTFNIFLLLLFFIIFLNLTDKLLLPDKCANYLSKLAKNKSFLTGFFAVIIACPCTGPFMGAALGYAIMQPAIIYFGIFFALGLGYALPYTLIELFPNYFLYFIPNPGRWMITLKRVLALPIALTCLWLGWVIFNQLKPSLINTDIQWEKYSPTIVSDAIQNNEPVFINFTAKWCLVCLLNEKSTFSTDTFKQTVQKGHIRLFKADWTNKDDDIHQALQAYGRNSIPLYVYYPADNKTPIILEQVLTPDIVRERLSD